MTRDGLGEPFIPIRMNLEEQHHILTFWLQDTYFFTRLVTRLANHVASMFSHLGW